VEIQMLIRDFQDKDRHAVDSVVLAAWQELSTLMPGWPELVTQLGALTRRAAESEVIVAELDGQIVGAVGYVGPNQPKPDIFEPHWPIVRLLSVAPEGRAKGLGSRLLAECVARAVRDGAECLALHTTPVMAAAQRLYQREGFEVLRQLPDRFGVPYVLMRRNLKMV
jgi:ribosomal protein S18 acetylase RimI-like enzyme